MDARSGSISCVANCVFFGRRYLANSVAHAVVSPTRYLRASPPLRDIGGTCYGGSPGGSASALSSKSALSLASHAFLRDDATHACNAGANRHKSHSRGTTFRFHSAVHQHDRAL